MVSLSKASEMADLDKNIYKNHKKELAIFRRLMYTKTRRNRFSGKRCRSI